MRVSEWLEWVAFGAFFVGCMIHALVRLNDPDEPLFSMSLPKWKHARFSVPFFLLAAVVGSTAFISLALGH